MENQRIRLSKAMLKEGLLTLLKEKPLNQITIYEICQTAQINRTTFYKYYGSQADLLRDIETDFLNRLDKDVEDVVEQNPHALSLVLQHLYEQRETFCILVGAIPTQEFAIHMFEVPGVARIFQNMVDAGSYSETEAWYIRQFVFQGTFAVLCSWLESKDPEPVAEIAEVLDLLRNKL